MPGRRWSTTSASSPANASSPSPNTPTSRSVSTSPACRQSAHRGVRPQRGFVHLPRRRPGVPALRSDLVHRRMPGPGRDRLLLEGRDRLLLGGAVACARLRAVRLVQGPVRVQLTDSCPRTPVSAPFPRRRLLPSSAQLRSGESRSSCRASACSSGSGGRQMASRQTVAPDSGTDPPGPSAAISTTATSG